MWKTLKNLKKGLKSVVSKHNESKKILTPKHIKKNSPIKYPKWLDEGLSSSEQKYPKWLHEGISGSKKKSSSNKKGGKKSKKYLKKQKRGDKTRKH